MTRERGFALVTVVLLVIGLAVLATGLAFAASQQAAVTGSLIDLVRARHGAEAAVGIALEDWSAARRSLDPVGEPARLLPAVAFDQGLVVAATAERIAPEVFVLTGTAVVRRGALPPIRRTAVRVVHSLDLNAIGPIVDAALIAGRMRLGGSARVVGAGSAAAFDPDAAALCTRWPVTGAALRAPPDSLTIAPAAELSGAPVIRYDAEPARLLQGLGGLDVEALRAVAPAVGSAAIAPAPALDGTACDTALTTNWGAPSGPCGPYHVLRRSPADLTLTGGYGQGILVVDGDLVMEGGHAFRGLIVVRGTATVRDAAIAGSIIAARLDFERGDATLDRCAIADALATIAATRAAYPPARSWLPTFD